MNAPIKINLTHDQAAGHAEHWQILTANINEQVPQWLQTMIDNAVLPKGLATTADPTNDQLLLSENKTCHINQVLQMKEQKPQRFINAYPCVHGPYGLNCQIQSITVNEETQDAILRLKTKDGTIIYAFDQLYAINQGYYHANQPYFVNFGAWSYQITPSQKDEVILVEDQEAIHYHRAFNDIVAANHGKVPDDIKEQIKHWKPDTDQPLAPIEINLGDMCAYLFGETLGQEDEAWFQGQVLGKSNTQFYGQDIILFDTVILREPDADPFVVRIATPSTPENQAIQVHDYIQGNIWLQAAIYQENQDK